MREVVSIFRLPLDKLAFWTMEEQRQSIARHRQGKWSPEENQLLTEAVQRLGEKQWTKVAAEVPGRSSVQCMHRWSKILRPGRVRGPWSAEEDTVLRHWVESMGASKWSLCASRIPGRNGKQCRERWYNALDPEVRKGAWSDQEDLTIFQLHSQIGAKWAEIARRLPGRTENSIKNRFYSMLRRQKFELVDWILAVPVSNSEQATNEPDLLAS